MDNLALELRREYVRAWRNANKDKVKRYNETYWMKKAQERREELERQKTEENGMYMGGGEHDDD